MKLYGYTENPEQSPMELTEVTVAANPSLLRQLSAFLSKCADEIENSNGQWEHEHFETNETDCRNLPSFIVYNSNAE